MKQVFCILKDILFTELTSLIGQTIDMEALILFSKKIVGQNIVNN